MAKETTSIYPLFPLTCGEKLLVFLFRLKQRAGLSAADVSLKMGYTSTYIPKLYALESFNRKQLNIVSNAINVPKTEFTESIDVKMSLMAQEIEANKERIKNLENRVRVLEAENSGLRQALQN